MAEQKLVIAKRGGNGWKKDIKRYIGKLDKKYPRISLSNNRLKPLLIPEAFKDISVSGSI